VNDLSLGRRIRTVARALRASGIPYAFGGAIALSYYAEPRATYDLDVNIFLPESESRRVLTVLGAAGIPIDVEDAARLVERDGQVRLAWGDIPLDLFFATVPFLDASAARTRDVPFEGEQIAILSAEDLAVCKVLFNRPKDWIDLRDMIRVQAGTIDTEYIRAWVHEMVGAADERARRFDKLLTLDRMNDGR
jgi:hypothetical protein